MLSITARERIVIPLDKDDVGEALGLVQLLAGKVGCFKVGLELIHAVLASIICPFGPAEARYNLNIIRELFNLLGKNIFWDGKFADIPNTVAGAAKIVNRLGVKWLNVHASAGRQAIQSAVDSARNCEVLGVTVLTSLGKDECVSIFGDEPNIKVLEFACMLLDCGAKGIICSPQEAVFLRSYAGFNGLVLVTPGVRPAWAAVGDQKRVMTPGEAITAGVDYLVVGRPITQPPPEIGGPVEAVALVAEEIEQALAAKAL